MSHTHQRKMLALLKVMTNLPRMLTLAKEVGNADPKETHKPTAFFNF